MPKTTRQAISVETAAAVYFRDGWICALCHRPTVFHLAFKYAGQFVATRLPDVQLAYFHPNCAETLRLCLTNSVLVSTTFTHMREAVRTIPRTLRRRVGSATRARVLERRRSIWKQIRRIG